MRIQILPSAQADLVAGYEFYEEKEIGLGSYFLKHLLSEIDSLETTAGIHAVHFGRYHRHLAGRFPWAIYYTCESDVAYVDAVLDCRRDPRWIRERLK